MVYSARISMYHVLFACLFLNNTFVIIINFLLCSTSFQCHSSSCFPKSYTAAHQCYVDSEFHSHVILNQVVVRAALYYNIICWMLAIKFLSLINKVELHSIKIFISTHFKTSCLRVIKVLIANDQHSKPPYAIHVLSCNSCIQ